MKSYDEIMEIWDKDDEKTELLFIGTDPREHGEFEVIGNDEIGWIGRLAGVFEDFFQVGPCATSAEAILELKKAIIESRELSAEELNNIFD